ncbi:MAG: putative photosynthetic complex assembly protein PuhE [Pseudomonadota bacterium]
MVEIICSVLFVVFAWWFSTGAVIAAARLSEPSNVWLTTIACIVLAGSMYALYVTSLDLTVQNIVLAFCSVIGVWAWHELFFLLGTLTGPRREACPPNARGWTRFSYAFAALRHHEFALFVTLIAIAVLTWHGNNQYGLAAFVLLWVMRLSAKLNLFFGVPHFSVDLMPDHLAYLSSYFRKRSITRFYLASVASGLLVAGWLIGRVTFTTDLSDAEVVGTTILATLLLLAVVEHLFMATSFRDTALWQWALLNVPLKSETSKPQLSALSSERSTSLDDGAPVSGLRLQAAVAQTVGEPQDGL